MTHQGRTGRRWIVLGVVTLLLIGGTTQALAQGLPALDRAALEAACQANAPDEEALTNCLAVVTEILVPEASPTSGASSSDMPFEPVRLKGKGDKVARFEIPSDAPAIADINAKGKGNFSVWSVGSDGDQQDLLVNEIGKYDGTVLFNTDDEPAVAFEITSDGNWTIVIKPLVAARQWDRASDLEGAGDDVVLIQPPIVGLATTEITHRGQGNFSLWTYTEDGDADLLVNEIDRYDGEVLLPDGTALLEVGAAGGRWSITAPT
jgi:hypothetical protein